MSKKWEKVKPFMKKSLEMLAQKLELESEPLAKKEFFTTVLLKAAKKWGLG